MDVTYFIAFVAPITLMSFVSYFIMLGANRLIWDHKGLPTDKASVEYRKRKRLLRILSIPVAISLFSLLGLVQLLL